MVSEHLDDCDVSRYHHLPRNARRHDHDDDAAVLPKTTLCVHRDSIFHSTWTLISHCDAAAVWTYNGLHRHLHCDRSRVDDDGVVAVHGDAVENETAVSARKNTHLHVPK